MSTKELPSLLQEFPDLQLAVHAMSSVLEAQKKPIHSRSLTRLQKYERWLDTTHYIYLQSLVDHIQTTLYPLKNELWQTIGYGLSQIEHLDGQRFTRTRLHAIDHHHNRIPIAKMANNAVVAIRQLDGQRRVPFGLAINLQEQLQPENILRSSEYPVLLLGNDQPKEDKIEYWHTIPGSAQEGENKWPLRYDIWRKVTATQTHVIWDHTTQLVGTAESPANSATFYREQNAQRKDKLTARMVVLRRLSNPKK